MPGALVIVFFLSIHSLWYALENSATVSFHVDKDLVVQTLTHLHGRPHAARVPLQVILLHGCLFARFTYLWLSSCTMQAAQRQVAAS